MVHLSRAEERALAAIDRAGLMSALAELLAVPSISGTDAECDVQHLLAKDLHDLGLDVDLWSMDVAELTGADGFPGAEPCGEFSLERFDFLAEDVPAGLQRACDGGVDLGL